MNDSTSFPLTEVNLNTHTSTAINEAKTNGHRHHHELTGQNGSLGGPVHRRHSRARAGQSMDVLVGMDIVDALEINVRGNTMGKEKQRPIVPPNPRGDPKVRQRWNNRIDFMVATIANVWRFPYLCYQYGGGTFLIPYLLSVVFLGAPMVVLELTIGQLLQLGATELFWHIHPRLKGIGLGALMTSVLVCCYYSIIMAWSLVFLSHSFQDPVPWKDKSNYFYDNIIHRSPDIGSLEGIELEVVLGLFIMWIIIYLTTMKGVTLQGKFSLITVVFPFIVLIVLFIKCLTLEGADEGIRYFIMPNWEKLWHVDIWVTAATQCFFSLSPCFGILVAFGSYLDYDKPTIVDGILITAINSFTSLFAGFVVFATLGYMANREGRPIDDVVENGPALAFIVYPEAISLMPGAPFWAIMFFLMLITLAIDSVFGYVEIINEWLLEFKQLQKWPRELLSLATCTGMFLAGIFFCTHAGIYWVELLDHFVPTFSLLELYEATGQYLSRFYKVCWKYIDPIVLMVLIAIIFIWEIKEPFQGLPTWSLGIAWTLSFCPILLVLYFAVFPSPPLEPRLPPANLKKKTSTDSNSPQPSPKSPHVDGDIATTNEIPPLNRAPGTAAVDNTAGENAVGEDIQTRDRQTKFGKQMARESTDDLGLMSVSDFTGRHHTASPTASNQSSSVEGAGEEGVDQHSATQLTGTKEKHKAKQTHKSWLKGSTPYIGMGVWGSRHVVPLQYKGVEGGGVRPEDGKRYPPATDLSRWTLEVCEGRQTWRYRSANDIEPMQNPIASRYLVGLPTDEDTPALPEPVVVEDSLRNAVKFYSKLQTADGHWAGDYGGPMFLLPGYAIVTYLTGAPVPEENKLEIVRYLSNTQSLDGGWGIHIESLPTVFGTALNYVVMRIFGVPRDDPRMVRARDWLQAHGGVLGIPQWGKVWLSVIGVFDWEGVNSLFPEMALLPRWFPFHSWRMWAYCRTVYLPMSYLYGSRFRPEITPLIQQLREELLPGPYETIQWASVRNLVAKEDLYTPTTWVLRTVFALFNIYEKICPRWLRQRALDWTYKVGVEKEDEFTKYICIGPVNKMFNMLCVWTRKGKDSPEFRNHLYRLPDYMWMGRDGMKMQGTNGSQLWDCAFMVQALVENRRIKDEFREVFQKAHDFLDLTQIKVDHPDHYTYYRDETKGGWPFSTRDIGYLVADCTGEGLKGALICKTYSHTPIPDERIYDAVNILINMQNTTGGYATIERTRGSTLFEWFNASEVFGEIMIDYDYVECTSSALTGLSLFHKLYPTHRPKEVKRAIQRAKDYMLSIQRPDGSWEGMWGICFTYGVWFAMDGLVEAGVPLDHPAIKKACAFLVSKQKEDGGWGETFMSCVTREYVQHPKSQVVNTAWAVLTLLRAGYSDRSVIDRGVKLLIERQTENGDWNAESICGVFNKNCMIDYSNFKNIFPIWALARYTEAYPDVRVGQL